MAGLRRRPLLRSLAAGPLAGLLAGCSLSGGDGSTPTTDRPPSPTLTAPPAEPTATPTPTATATPSDTPSPTPTDTPTATPTPTGEQRLRSFVERLAAAEYEQAHSSLTTDYASQLGQIKLQRYWLGLLAQHGAFERVTDVTASTREGRETTAATVECAEGAAPVEIAVEGDRVDRMWFPAEYSPPAYADQSAFTEREVTVDAEGCALAGTLALPAGASADSPVPGAVLVHGSGRHDRNETIGPNEVFRDLAWGLASRGAAVLRYDKRTHACDVPLDQWGIDNIVVDDAIRALETLRGVDAVRSDATVVVGHSLGATCTPRILSRDDRAAAGAMLAANARPITDVSIDQVRHYFSVDGTVTDREESLVGRVRRAFDRLEAGEFSPGQVVQNYPVSWWTSLLEYDQVATAQSTSIPLWIAQGGRDFQVLRAESFARWQSALDGRANASFAAYPDLSHIFQPGAEPSLQEEYVFQDNVAGTVVTDLADWIESVT